MIFRAIYSLVFAVCTANFVLAQETPDCGAGSTPKTLSDAKWTFFCNAAHQGDQYVCTDGHQHVGRLNQGTFENSPPCYNGGTGYASHNICWGANKKHYGHESQGWIYCNCANAKASASSGCACRDIPASDDCQWTNFGTPDTISVYYEH